MGIWRQVKRNGKQAETNLMPRTLRRKSSLIIKMELGVFLRRTTIVLSMGLKDEQLSFLELSIDYGVFYKQSRDLPGEENNRIIPHITPWKDKSLLMPWGCGEQPHRAERRRMS